MTKFEKGVIIAELLSDDFEMVGEEMPVTTDAFAINKKAKELIENNPDLVEKLLEDNK